MRVETIYTLPGDDDERCQCGAPLKTFGDEWCSECKRWFAFTDTDERRYAIALGYDDAGEE